MNCLRTWTVVELRAHPHRSIDIRYRTLPLQYWVTGLRDFVCELRARAGNYACLQYLVTASLVDVVAGRLQYLSYCVPVMWRTANALQLNRWSETGSTLDHIPGYVKATCILDNTVDANQCSLQYSVTG